PASSPRFLAKARGLAADEVFLDLEDAVAPAAKAGARAAAVAALADGGWDGKVIAVRVKDAATGWAYRDVVEVVEGAGARLAAIDGPHLDLGDPAGLRQAAASAAALGYDGKWVVHPGQIDTVNQAFTPGQEEYDQAELILDACEYYATVEGRGAARLGGEMI